MKINETHPREKGFILWGHCQNILDDPRILVAYVTVGLISYFFYLSMEDFF